MIELGRDKVLSVQATLQQSPEWKVLGAARFVSLCLALLIMSSFIDAKVAELQKSLEGRIVCLAYLCSLRQLLTRTPSGLCGTRADGRAHSEDSLDHGGKL